MAARPFSIGMGFSYSLRCTARVRRALVHVVVDRAIRLRSSRRRHTGTRARIEESVSRSLTQKRPPLAHADRFTGHSVPGH